MRFRPIVPVVLTTLVLPGCQASAPQTVESPVQARMFEHFGLARDLRTYAVSGNLEDLREAARELAALDDTWGMPPGAEGFEMQLRAGARAAAAAETNQQAAHAVADLSRVCGDCHVANQVPLGTRFQVAPPLVDDPATRHTNYLSWVSRLLWDGLVGPSERMWREGVYRLSDVDGVPDPAATHVPGDEIDRTGEMLRDIAAEGLSQEDPSARARLLGDLWTICADCHFEAGVR